MGKRKLTPLLMQSQGILHMLCLVAIGKNNDSIKMLKHYILNQQLL